MEAWAGEVVVSGKDVNSVASVLRRGGSFRAKKWSDVAADVRKLKRYWKRKTVQSLLTSATSVLPGQCFAGYEKFDLLWNGRKIAGAAQRRNKLGLLIQGSVQSRCIGTAIARADWQKAMRDVGRVESGVEWSDFAPDEQ